MEKGGVMTRKDSEKDADRPHYYSQFWLDIAAGRRVIGGPKPDEAETSEVEILEPVPARRPARNGTADSIKTTRASAVVEPEVEEEEELEQDDTVEEVDLPNIVFDDDAEDIEVAEVAEEDLSEEEPASEDEDVFEDEEEEEEEDGEWDRRGRKKAKPVRPVKPVKKVKREPRRNF
jgi:hypothetical protein